MVKAERKHLKECNPTILSFQRQKGDSSLYYDSRNGSCRIPEVGRLERRSDMTFLFEDEDFKLHKIRFEGCCRMGSESDSRM